MQQALDNKPLIGPRRIALDLEQGDTPSASACMRGKEARRVSPGSSPGFNPPYLLTPEPEIDTGWSARS